MVVHIIELIELTIFQTSTSSITLGRMLLLSSSLLMNNNDMQGRQWNQQLSRSNNNVSATGAAESSGNPVTSAQASNSAATNSSSASTDLSADDVSGRLLPFPFRLHRMLEHAEKRGKQDIVSWLPFGRSFKVHKPDEFIKEIAPVYFNLTQYKSFQRQLLNYGFMRIESGGFGKYIKSEAWENYSAACPVVFLT